MSDEPEYHLLLSLFLQALAKPGVIDVKMFYKALGEVSRAQKETIGKIIQHVDEMQEVLSDMLEKTVPVPEKPPQETL